MIINNIGINFAGGGGGGSEARLESKNFTLTQNGSTPIRPSSGYDGISGGTIEVNVDTTPAYNSGYTEGYASGYTSGETDGYATGYASGETAGIAEQKALLTSTTITENGTVTSENGFSAVTVDVQGEENRFNKYMTNTLTAVTQNDLAGVTSIPQYCFYLKSNLKSVDLPSSVNALGVSAFQNTGIETLDVSNITSFSNNDFLGCYSLTGLTGFEKYSGTPYASLFQGCSGLTGDFQTRMSGTTQHNYTYLFDGCSGLQSVTWLSNQKEFGGTATYNNPYARCTSMEYIDYTHNYVVPTLRFVNPFTAFTANYEIRVPQILYDEWTASTNWNNSDIVGHIKAYPNIKQYEAKILYKANSDSALTPYTPYTNLDSWGAKFLSEEYDASTGGTVEFYGPVSFPTRAYSGTSITSIVIPYGTKTIEPDAFHGCSALSSAIFPKSPITIKTQAFMGAGLSGALMPPPGSELLPNAFLSCPITSATLYKCTLSGSALFGHCHNLKYVTIDECVDGSLNYESYNIFLDCTGITEAFCNSNLSARTLANTFSTSSQLKGISFGPDVTTIDTNSDYLFNSNQAISKLAFSGPVPTRRSVTLTQGLAATGNIFAPAEYMDDYKTWLNKWPKLANWNWYPATFADAEIDIAEAGPHKIGHDFAQLDALYDVLIDGVSVKASLVDETYNFPSAGTYVITWVFNDSAITAVPEGTDIKSFRASYSMTSINNYALRDCTALTEVSLPEVTQIGTFSFQNDALTDMYAPKLVNVGKKALRYNSNFNPVTYFDFSQLETIGDNAFASTGVDEVHFGPGLSSVSYNLFNSCPNLKVITFDENTTGLTEFQSVGDNIPLETITFPDCIQTYCQASMQYGLFMNSSALTSVTFGSGATTFQGLVFGGSMPALTSITCKATTAPSIQSGAFVGVTANTGTLHVPQGSDFSAWLTELGSNWTVAYDA